MNTWKSSEYRHKIYRWGILTLGILFIGIGISRGELETVLAKAVLICLECIGIG